MSDNPRVALLVSMPLIFSLIERVATRRPRGDEGRAFASDPGPVLALIQSFRSGAGYVAR